jgi:hypothetical protein
MVSSCGWAGFVFGPPIIGALASATTLTTALGVLPLLTACVVVATARTHALRAPSEQDPPAAGAEHACDVHPVQLRSRALE